ncbi:MAG: hypothetical protein FJ276_35710 [Planctomycetes bacterium]|nr:hypothetical protein [Planctomycetota bacterium]
MYQETGIRLWRWANAVSCLGVLQFLVLSILATHRYAGGTIWERHRVGYSYSENYLSDLGRTEAWSGVSNRSAARLFNGGVIILGASLVPFFLFLPAHAPDKSSLLWIAAVFGIFSTVALIRIGLTPYDTHLAAHQTALVLWVLLLLITVGLHAWALLTSTEASTLFGLVSFLLAMLIVTYGIRGMEGMDATAQRSVPALQKGVVLGAVGWYLAFSARMICTRELAHTERDTTLDESARQYLRRLGRYR